MKYLLHGIVPLLLALEGLAQGVGINTSSPQSMLDVRLGGTTLPAINASTVALFQYNNATTDGAVVSIIGGNTAPGNSQLTFGDEDDQDIGRIVYSHGTEAMRFFTNTSEQMRIDTDGDVGIGTTNPTLNLHVYGTGGSTNMRIEEASATTTDRTLLELENNGGTRIQFTDNNTSKSWVTSAINAGFRVSKVGSGNTEFEVGDNGHVGINTTGAEQMLHIVSDADPNAILIDSYGAVASNVIGRRSNGTIATPTAVTANDLLLLMLGQGHDGTGFPATGHARIGLYANENWTATDKGTHIKFWTTPDGSTTTAEVVRIDDNGNVGIGTTSPSEKLQVGAADAGESKVRIAGGSTGSNEGGELILNTAADFDGTYDFFAIDAFQDYLRIRRDGIANDIALTSSGTVGIGTTAPQTKLHVLIDGTAGTPAVSGLAVAAFQRSATAGTNSYVNIIGGNAANSGLMFGDTDDSDVGIFRYDHTANEFEWLPNAGSQAMVLTSAGNLGIGTTSASARIHVAGGDENLSSIRIENTGVAPNGVNLSYRSNNIEVAKVRALTTDDTDGELQFFTMTSSTLTKRMVLTEEGHLGLGTDNPGNELVINSGAEDNNVIIHTDANGGYDASIHVGESSSGGFGMSMRYDESASQLQFVRHDNSTPGDVVFYMNRSDDDVTYNGSVTLTDLAAHPTNPTSGTEGRIYIKGDLLVVSYNDAGTMKYRYMDLTSTNANWTYTTTAP